MHEHISSQTLLMQQSDSCSLCTWNGSKHIWLYESERESRSVMSNPLQPMDYTVHGILQARILEWIAFPFSRGSSQPRDWTQVSHIAGGFFINWAAREAQIHGSEHYFLNQLASTIWAKSPPCISLVFTTVPSRAVGIWKAFSKCL